MSEIKDLLPLMLHYTTFVLFIYLASINIKYLRDCKVKLDRMEFINTCIFTWVSYTEATREALAQKLDATGNININIVNVPRKTK